MKRRLLLSGTAASLCTPRMVFAQSGRTDAPLTIVFPYGAGGAVDGIIRTLAEYMSGALKRPVIVDNKPGANSIIGAEYVARARPDGNTLLWAAWPTLTTNLALYPSIRFSHSNFAPITSTIQGYTGLSVANQVPAHNFKELVDHVKKNGNQLAYGSLGKGGSPHLMMELGSIVSGVKFDLVPYKSDVQGIGDLLGGHLTAYAGPIANQAPHHQAKTLRIIAISSENRLPDLPDVPTFKEAGFPELVVSYWHGVVAPAGMPRNLITEFNQVIAAGMQQPSVKGKLALDQRVMTSSPESFKSLIESDTKKWGDLIRSRGIKLE